MSYGSGLDNYVNKKVSAAVLIYCDRLRYSFLLKGKACRVLQYQCMSRPEMCFRFPDPTKVFVPVLNILL